VFGVTDTDRRPRLGDVAVYLLAVAGLTACLTLVFLSMRAVLDIGGFCAEGGPFVIETHCPEGVPLLLTGGIFGLFGFGGLMAWRGSRLGEAFGALVLLAWPALFLSLGWNFLEYGLWPPGPAQGVVLGWLIPGLVFMLMGGLPLLALRPAGGAKRAGSGVFGSSGAGGKGGDPSSRMQRAKLLAGMVELRKLRATDDDLVSKLERLSALRREGTLTELEFEQAKRRLLEGTHGA
jgi:hypothetical protein